MDASRPDPYHRWLAIPPGPRPPDHYRLLGVDPGERDPVVIGAAMERQAAYVRHFRQGPDGEHATRIIGELVEAARTLTNPGRRAEYDKSLAGAATVGVGPGARGRRAGSLARSLAYAGFTVLACGVAVALDRGLDRRIPVPIAALLKPAVESVAKSADAPAEPAPAPPVPAPIPAPPPRKIELRIVAYIDGSDRLNLNADGARWSHLDFNPPVDVRLNGVRWDVRSGRPLLNSGPSKFLDGPVDFLTAKLTLNLIRDAARLNHVSNGIYVDFVDGPKGHHVYDVTVSFDPPGSPPAFARDPIKRAADPPKPPPPTPTVVAPAATAKARELLQVGNGHGLRQSFATAVECYDEAIALDPTIAEIYMHRGKALMYMGDLGRAVTSFDRAILIDLNYAEAFYHRSWAYWGDHKPEPSRADYRQAVGIDPSLSKDDEAYRKMFTP